ncbi:MAG: hypothetical protein ACU0BS_13050 [Hasllibacter sp.]
MRALAVLVPLLAACAPASGGRTSCPAAPVTVTGQGEAGLVWEEGRGLRPASGLEVGIAVGTCP